MGLNWISSSPSQTNSTLRETEKSFHQLEKALAWALSMDFTFHHSILSLLAVTCNLLESITQPQVGLKASSQNAWKLRFNFILICKYFTPVCCWRQPGPSQPEGFSRITLAQAKDDPWRTNKCWQSGVLGKWLCWVLEERFHCLKPIVLQVQITECFLGVHELGTRVSRGLVKGRMVSLLTSFSI